MKGRYKPCAVYAVSDDGTITTYESMGKAAIALACVPMQVRIGLEFGQKVRDKTLFTDPAEYDKRIEFLKERKETITKILEGHE